ncbi:sporulation integral membrane protein YlbJ [Paenibacillus cymbidii]|uniref:sporulation integral membrane protein YlbJ n=1 Tax=Paenibacillus cymbidii TaxID=1639034 RepID=UPI001080CB80|nr:sporulation integral membrane protein YlbJ [Paenibacillus cymbidii]
MATVRLRLPLIAAPIVAVILYMLLLHPAETVPAAVKGVAIWWDVLFPALFPFFVISELLLGFGIVHLFGTLLDPLMRPLFRIPGIGGFVMTMGFASGYPVAAKLTAQLWDQSLIKREEGERLVAFVTTSDPIFLIGAVSVGFFHDARIAVVLAIAHFGAAAAVGLLMRFHGRKAPMTPVTHAAEGAGIVKRALRAMHRARLADGRPIGTLLRQSIESAIPLVFVIGGLVVFFAVVLEALRISHMLGLLQTATHTLLQLAGLPQALSDAVVNGFFEVTLGAQAAGGAGSAASLADKAAVASFVLAWAGLSVHAQIASLLHRTNLRYWPFALARLAHGVLAAVLVKLLWGPLEPLLHAPAAFAGIGFDNVASSSVLTRYAALPPALAAGIALLAALLLLSALAMGLARLWRRPPFPRAK